MSAAEKVSRVEFPPIQLGALERSLEFFVSRASTALMRQWSSRWGDSGFRPRFYHALALIGANPGISLMEMANFIAIDKSGGSEVIEYMKEANLIARKRSSWDHRRQGLYLTPWGARRLAEMQQDVARQSEPVDGLYTEAELRNLIELLQRLPVHGTRPKPATGCRGSR